MDNLVVIKQKSWRELLVPYLPFFILITCYQFFVYGLAKRHGLENLFEFGLYNSLIVTTAKATLSLILVGYLFWLALVQKEKQPLRRAMRDLRNHVLNARNIVEVAIPIIALPLFISSLTCFKSIIPILNPFYLDVILVDIDQVLHGGLQPWELTHRIVSSTNGSYVISILYSLWFVVMWGFLFWQILRINKPMQRQQFFISFSLCWIVLGSIFAYYWSSAGPVYFGRVTGLPDIYAPLLERLQVMHIELLDTSGWKSLGITNLEAQKYLWESYSSREVNVGVGISAMPSLHVSIATLLALSAWQINKLFGLILALYAIIILFGSVHLGWHYAIDGYFSVILTIIIWYTAGRLLQCHYKERC